MNTTVELSVSIDYSMSRSLGNTSDYSDYLNKVCGRITGYGCLGQQCETVEIGRLRLYVIQVGNATNDSADLNGVFDTTQETLDAGSVVYDGSYHEFEPTVAMLFEDAFPTDDLLLLDRLEIYPPFRGQKLGLTILHQAIRDWSGGCSLAVMKPFPLQFGAAVKKSESWSQLRLDTFPSKKATAFSRLRAYYEKLGFVRIGKSEFFALCPKQEMPSAEELKLPDTISIGADVFTELTAKERVAHEGFEG